MLEGAVGRLLATVAVRVREVELGLSLPTVRSGRLAVPDGLSAGRAGSVRGAAGQHGRTRAPQKGWIPPPDSQPGRSTGTPLCLHLTGGPRHDRTQDRTRVKAWTGAPLPCLIADRAYDGDAFRAWRAQPGIEAVLPARKGRTNPQSHDPERYPARNAGKRDLGWLTHGEQAQTPADMASGVDWTNCRRCTSPSPFQFARPRGLDPVLPCDLGTLCLGLAVPASHAAR